MSPTLRNAVAIIAGVLVGAIVNSSLIAASGTVVPLPAGIDPKNAESLARGMALFEPRHFLMPFLAHALGTLAGALVAYVIAASHRERIAYAIGVLFLCGGIAATFMIPAPAWFIALDLLVAYLPMSWLAIQLGSRFTRDAAVAAAA